MPDLGKYEWTVLSAYGAGIVLLGALIAFSIWRARRVKRQLAEVEKRMKNAH